MKKLASIFAFILSAVSATASHPAISAKGDTALIKSVKDGNHKVVKNLLKNRQVFVNELGEDQKTALDLAVEYGDTKIALLLVKYGAKVILADNVFYLKSMLKDRGLKYLISFAVMFIFGSVISYIFALTVAAIEVSLGFLALAIPAGVGVIVYAGYMWSRPFKAYSMYSKVEQNWMIQIPTIA